MTLYCFSELSLKVAEGDFVFPTSYSEDRFRIFDPDNFQAVGLRNFLQYSYA
jgi:hypothetical protein